ncbi:helix-turn-helix domain-containing protein [Parasphingopyxis marina]|uniref:Helix-turn-helix domain-containing protein n=1 Tax=Parasphingopyxis marina TaxID=2761622 RepID=A0A842HXJ5_9SPHN|nr:helix-turn-helix domain-containing protein [Parasphingopyxis marina]MBC2777029.1 helix-turn-helix domain-containing protein [Parasphingopyxis marina]
MVENCNRLTTDLADVLPPEDSQDYLMMVMQLSGEVRIENRGHTNILRPGTLGLYRFSRNCDALYAEEGARQLVGIVPRQELTARTPSMTNILQRQFPHDSAVCSLAFNFLTGLYESAEHLGMTRPEMSDVAINLLQVAIAEQVVGSEGVSYRDKIRVRVRGYVDRHIHDPNLSVESVAAAMRCSSRHLQAIFADQEPLGRYIWRTRLERCAAVLREPGCAALSITEIAFSMGFSNASHFSRAFKARFGASPKSYRGCALH